MKAEYGDKITIPEGCKVIVKDGCVVFEKEQTFKDGDILVSVEKNHRHNAFIFKSTDEVGRHSYYVGLDAISQLSICENSDYRWCGGELSYATEEEKQLLFDKMNEQGLKWNSDKKQVEEIRWIAKENESYYFVSATGVIGRDENKESQKYRNFARYKFFNFFRTEKQATEARNRIKEALEKYHHEIGE